LIYHGVKALVPHRTEEFKLLDDYQMLLLLELFPELVKKKVPSILRKIKKELVEVEMRINHSYALTLLRAIDKIRSYSLADKDLVNVAVLVCHKQRHRYPVNDILTILRLFRNLGYYQSVIFNDFAALFCEESGTLYGVGITHKISALHWFCRQSYYHRGLFENIENCVHREADSMRITDLLHYLYCCWAYNYSAVATDSLDTVLDLLLKKLVLSGEGIHVGE
jgi:hypothetical protein